MADITMCEGGICPDKLKCYRYTAQQNPWRQSFFMIVPFKPGQECQHFTPNYDEEANAKDNDSR